MLCRRTRPTYALWRRLTFLDSGVASALASLSTCGRTPTSACFDTVACIAAMRASCCRGTKLWRCCVAACASSTWQTWCDCLQSKIMASESGPQWDRRVAPARTKGWRASCHSWRCGFLASVVDGAVGRVGEGHFLIEKRFRDLLNLQDTSLGLHGESSGREFRDPKSDVALT